MFLKSSTLNLKIFQFSELSRTPTRKLWSATRKINDEWKYMVSVRLTLELMHLFYSYSNFRQMKIRKKDICGDIGCIYLVIDLSWCWLTSSLSLYNKVWPKVNWKLSLFPRLLLLPLPTLSTRSYSHFFRGLCFKRSAEYFSALHFKNSQLSSLFSWLPRD